MTVSKTLADSIRGELTAAGDPDRAPGMQAYMKSTLPYYGVPVPTVRSLTRSCARRLPPADLDELSATARELFDHGTHREEWYAALALLALPIARGQLELVPLHEHFASTGAWWDVVDETAHRIADLHDAHPDETAGVVRHWARSDDLWLRRLAIISQLGRHDRVDAQLLADVIEQSLPAALPRPAPVLAPSSQRSSRGCQRLTTADREFFIRKAIGWALRDHARTAPDWVRTFADSHELSPLSRREALKHLGI